MGYFFSPSYTLKDNVPKKDLGDHLSNGNSLGHGSSRLLFEHLTYCEDSMRDFLTQKWLGSTPPPPPQEWWFSRWLVWCGLTSKFHPNLLSSLPFSYEFSGQSSPFQFILSLIGLSASTKTSTYVGIVKIVSKVWHCQNICCTLG